MARKREGSILDVSDAKAPRRENTADITQGENEALMTSLTSHPYEEVDKSPEFMELEEFALWMNSNAELLPYDPRKDPPSGHPWFSVDAESLLTQAVQFCQELGRILEPSDKTDTELRMLQRANDNAHHPRDVERLSIALIGSQGTGRSSIVNALFHNNKIAISSAGLRACTCAILRYTYAPAMKSGHYAITVKFHGFEYINNMLCQLTRHFYQYKYAPEITDLDDDADSYLHTAADMILKIKAENVFNALMGPDGWAAFRPYDFADGVFVTALMKRCMTIVGSAAETMFERGFSATTEEALMDTVREYATSKSGAWPIVKEVQIGFQDRILAQGIDILDFPGTQDVKFAQNDYLQEVRHNCTHELVVAETVRYFCNDGFMTLVREALKRKSVENVILSATQTDDKCDVEHDRTQSNYASIESRIQETKSHIKSLQGKADRAANAPIYEISVLRDYIAYLKRFRQALIIADRRNEIKSTMADQYRSMVDGITPTTFATSSKEYLKWVGPKYIDYRDFRPHLVPILKPEATEIPRLRTFIHSLGAEKNMNRFSTYFAVTLPDVLEKVQRVMSTGTREEGFTPIIATFEIPGHDDAMCSSVLDAHEAYITAASKSLKETLRDAEQGCSTGIAKLRNAWMNRDIYALKTFSMMVENKGKPTSAALAKWLEKQGHSADWVADIEMVFRRAFVRTKKAVSDEKQRMNDSLKAQAEAFFSAVEQAIDMSGVGDKATAAAVKEWKKQAVVCMVHFEEYWAKLDAAGVIEYECVLPRKKKKGIEDIASSTQPVVENLSERMFGKIWSTVPSPESGGKKRKRRVHLIVAEGIDKYVMSTDKTQPPWIVQQVHSAFLKRVIKTLAKAGTDLFDALHAQLKIFLTSLQLLAPPKYVVTDKGTEIRENLRTEYPALCRALAEMQTAFGCPLSSFALEMSGTIPTQTDVAESDATAALPEGNPPLHDDGIGTDAYTDTTSAR